MNSIQFGIGLLIAILGVLMLRAAFKKLSLAKESLNWPITSGEIEDISFLKKRLIDDKMVYCENLVVRYKYKVDGKTYASSTLAYFNLVYPETTDFAEAKPKGSVVNVYYQQSNPSHSVLLTGPGEKPYSNVILSFLLVPVGIVVMCMAVFSVN